MKRTHQRGFTAIELMVVVVIAAILLAIAVPSFSGLINRQRVAGLANDLSADIQYARSQAVSHNANVGVTVTESGYAITMGNDTIKSVSTLPIFTTLSADNSVTFWKLRGLTFEKPEDARTVTFTVGSSAISNQLKIIINPMGRAELCAPSASWGGYAVCS